MRTFRCDACTCGPCEFKSALQGSTISTLDDVCPLDGADDADWEEITE